MSSNTFNPYGPAFRRTVTAGSTTVVPTLTSPPTALTPLPVSLDLQVVSVGTQTVFLAYAYAGAAAPTAAIPADGAVGAVLAILPNTTRTFEFPYGTQFAVIAASVGSDVYATWGAGNNG